MRQWGDINLFGKKWQRYYGYYTIYKVMVSTCFVSLLFGEDA